MGGPFAALVCASCVVVILSWLLLKYVKLVWLEPKKLERLLNDQGIKGSPYKFLMGDLRDNARLMSEAWSKPIPLTHDIVPRVAPLFDQLVKTHGKMCVTWFGPIPRVTIIDPELAKEILSNKFGHFAKPKSLASGLVSYDGEKWAKHRRIINPAFHQEKLKLMMPAFSNSCVELINKWKNLVDSSDEEHCELDVWPKLQNLTGDVISRTAFGSNYEEGRRIFQLQNELAELLAEIIPFTTIPGYRFLPTIRNIRMRKIDKEVRKILGDLISKRIKAMKMEDVHNDDLLGILIESNFKLGQQQDSKSLAMTVEEVIEECKLFYFAGQETTASLLTWTIILLSIHSEWQTRARQEVMQVFGDNKPDYDGLHNLKIVTMILYEVLRLYPPFAFLLRCTYKKMKLGKVTFPPGVQLTIPILFIHHDPEYWGDDANEFKPERFSEGIAKASKNHIAFYPFGWGPRICIGQSFALIEAKLALAMMLQNFSFELSPTYSHAPRPLVTLQPQHGAQILLRRL